MFDSPVYHVTYSKFGGAGQVAKKLVQGQKDLGVETHLITKSNTNLRTHPLSDPAALIRAVFDDLIISKRDSHLFTHTRNRLRRLSRDLMLDGAVINLHWLPGILDDKWVSVMLEARVKVFWTLHDFRPMTSGCHYADGCQKFKTDCSRCPQVNSMWASAIERSFESKVKMLSSSGLNFISPSNGLLEALGGAAMLKGNSIQMIPNPLGPYSQGPAVGNPENEHRNVDWLLVATDLAEPRKQVMRALRWWSENAPADRRLLLVGAKGSQLGILPNNVTNLGVLDRSNLQRLMRSSRGLFFSSRQDNAPGVVAEAVEAGMEIFCLDDQMRSWLALDKVPMVDHPFRRISNGKNFPSNEYSQFVDARRLEAVSSKYLQAYSGN